MKVINMRMKKEIIEKIKRCKALQGKSVQDVLCMPKFKENLAAYWTAQREDRKAIRASYEAMRKAGGAKGYKLPAHPIDDLMNLTAQEMRLEFANVLDKASKRSAAERLYIRQLGQQALNLTTAQMVVEEFPELEGELIPKSAN